MERKAIVDLAKQGFWKLAESNAVTIATAIEINNMTDKLWTLSRRDFLKLSALITASCSGPAQALVTATGTPEQKKKGTETPKKQEYFGRFDPSDDTETRGQINASFKLDPNNVYTFQVKTGSFSGSGGTDLKFAYTQEATTGRLRTFFMKNPVEPVELSRELVANNWQEFYTDGNDKHIVHIYPENSAELLTTGQVFDAKFFPSDDLLPSFPGYTKGEPILTQIGSEGGKVYAILAKPESQLPEGLADITGRLKGTDYKLVLNKNNEVVYVYVNPTSKEETVVPDLIIDPVNKTIVRKYTFVGPEGYQPVELTQFYTKDHLISRNFQGWRIVDGQWVRENVIGPDEKETNIPKYSTSEVVEMILQDSAAVEAKLMKDLGDERGKAEFLNEDTQTRRQSLARAYELLGLDGETQSIRYEGMQFRTIGYYVADSHVYIIDKDGNKIDTIPTVFLAYEQFKAGQTDIRWKDVNGNLKEFIIDANLGTIEYYEKHNYTPLVIIQ